MKAKQFFEALGWFLVGLFFCMALLETPWSGAVKFFCTAFVAVVCIGIAIKTMEKPVEKNGPEHYLGDFVWDPTACLKR